MCRPCCGPKVCCCLFEGWLEWYIRTGRLRDEANVLFPSSPLSVNEIACYFWMWKNTLSEAKNRARLYIEHTSNFWLIDPCDLICLSHSYCSCSSLSPGIFWMSIVFYTLPLALTHDMLVLTWHQQWIKDIFKCLIS